MHRRRHRAEQMPPAARPWLAPPALRPSMPIANCTAGLSKPRAGEQPPKPGRPRPRPRLIAPPYAPGSTADDAQLLPRHPLQRLLLDCPEGPSFAQRSPPDHTSQAGSDRTLTLYQMPPYLWNTLSCLVNQGKPPTCEFKILIK